MFYMKNSFYFLSFFIIFVLLSSSDLIAQESQTFKNHLSDALLRLYDQEVKGYHYKFSTEITFIDCGDKGINGKGTSEYCNFEENYYSDKYINYGSHFSKSLNRQVNPSLDAYQFIKIKNTKLIGIYYEYLNNNLKQTKSVFCDPKAPFEKEMRRMYTNINFQNIFTIFQSLGMSPPDICKLVPIRTSVSPNGDLVGEYQTEYGTMALNLVRQRELYYFAGGTLKQTRQDRYTSLGNIKLFEVKEAGPGELPQGLDTVTSSFLIKRNFQKENPEITEISSYSEQAGSGKSMQHSVKMTTKSVTKIKSIEEFKKLHLSIPEGKFVSSLDPEYRSLKLTYRNGDIVREVDGTSLEQVVVETQNRKRMWLVLSAVGGLFATAGAAYLGLVWWRRRKAPDGAKS
jgi:hypothetical protein